MFENAGRLAQIIDHTLVRPDATLDDLAKACKEARQYGFAALIVNGCHVAKAKAALAGTSVKVGAVVGFPHGMSTTTVKIVEAMEAMKNGADEVDIVMNVGLVKSGRMDLVEIDTKNVIVMTKNLVHKAILETGLLTVDEVKALCQVAVRSGAEFVKTCTGYGPRGVTVEDVRLIRQVVGATCRVKASGGIRDLATVTAMVEAGAERVGTSTGASIMEEYRKQGKG
jgi:deoxyribose-phosphate aldolase